MNLNDFSLLMLIVHFLGDFQLQTEALARKKRQSAVSLACHILIIAALHAAAALLSGTGTILYLLVLTACHALLDALKPYAVQELKNLSIKNPASTRCIESAVYLTDQALHLALIFLLMTWISPHATLPAQLTKPVLQWILLFIVNLKPANVTFKILFGSFAPDTINLNRANITFKNLSESFTKNKETKDDETTRPGAGALIGMLERIITLLLLSVSQYAAVGLILTAKSVARYDRISKSQQFAEYYLIGTLFSVLWAIASYILIMKIF